MTKPLIPFQLPSIDEDDIVLVTQAMRSKWLTMGKMVSDFETQFAQKVDGRYAISTNSCTAALHLALCALNIKEGDDVLVPTMTFTATAEAVLYMRARPVLVDCQKDTLNMDSTDAERKITKKTKVIIPVHVAGLPCDMEAIQQLAKRYQLKIIQDAAHAFPTKYRGIPIVSLSDATCFSFYATKPITTGEGGMVVTNDEIDAKQMKILRLHGISRDPWSRNLSPHYDILEAGFKYNLTEMAAALGLSQLKKADLFWEKRFRIAQLYTQELKMTPEIILPHPGHLTDQHAWHLYTIRLKTNALKITRDELINILLEKGIQTSIHWKPLHLHPFYQKNYGFTPHHFPNATEVFEQILSLPIYPDLKEQEVLIVCSTLKEIIQKYRL